MITSKKAQHFLKFSGKPNKIPIIKMGIINVLYSLHPDKRRPTIDRYTNMIVKFEIVLHMDAAVQGFAVKHAKLSCFHILEPSFWSVIGF